MSEHMNPILERELDNRIAYLVIGGMFSPNDDEISIRSCCDELTIGPNTSREIFVFSDIPDEKHIRFFYALFHEVSFSFFSSHHLLIPTPPDCRSDDSYFFFGDIEGLDHISRTQLTPGDNLLGISHGTSEEKAGDIPRESPLGTFVRIKHILEIRNRDNMRTEIQKWCMKMREIHAIDFGSQELSNKEGLLLERSYLRVDEDFLESRVRYGILRKLRFLEKKNIFIVSPILSEVLDEILYKSVVWENGYIVHPTVYTDAHSIKIVRNFRIIYGFFAFLQYNR